MGVTNGFTKNPLSQLGPDIQEIKKFYMPREETLTDTTKIKKEILESYQTGIITIVEMQQELQALK